MARIEFRPVCSKCKQVLYVPVGISSPEHDLTGYSGHTYGIVLAPNCTLEPYKCPTCGAKFEQIVMNTRAPLDGEAFVGYPDEDDPRWQQKDVSLF